MRIKAVALILLVLLIPILVFIPVSSAAVGISTVQGIVGTEVTFTGLTAAQSYTVTWGGSIYKVGTVSGTGTASMIIPEAATGVHTVNVESPSGTLIYSATFTVLPSISINPSSGIVGTTITVKGTGFQTLEENIIVTFDGATIKSTITANSNGTWETTITVPAATAGSHVIDASGNNTTADAIANKTVTVSPSISITPTFGSVGTQVTISGSGFAASEGSISFTYDGTVIKSNISAGATGSWSSSFTVPHSTTGNHTVDASGASTSSSAITDVMFSVSSGIAVQPAVIQAGDNVSISGSGFSNAEKNIKIFFDGVVMKSDISADTNGYWTASLTIPEAVNGSHEFDASGDTTSITQVQGAVVTVQANLVLKPTTGNVGQDIVIYGTGFSRSSVIDVDYGGRQLSVSLKSDSNGNFTASFVPFEGMSGQIKIQAKDAKGVTSSAVFNMEATPPEAPRIAAPKDGARVGLIGDTRVTFDWTDSNDPSGVYYAFQLSRTRDFSSTMINVTKLTTSHYALTEAEALGPGEYFWRVKAYDKAGNSGDWIGPFVVRTAFFDFQTFGIYAVSFIVFLILLMTVPRAIVRAARKDDWGKK